MHSSHQIQENSADFEKQNQQEHLQECKFIVVKQRSLLYISAAYCDHLQGGVLWRIYNIERQNNLQIKC
jgi:hypothetical protein